MVLIGLLVLYTIRWDAIIFLKQIQTLPGRQSVNSLERLVRRAQLHVVSYAVNDEKWKEQEERVGWMEGLIQIFPDGMGLS